MTTERDRLFRRWRSLPRRNGLLTGEAGDLLTTEEMDYFFKTLTEIYHDPRPIPDVISFLRGRGVPNILIRDIAEDGEPALERNYFLLRVFEYV